MDNRFQKKAYKQKLKLVRIFNFKEIDEKIARIIILGTLWKINFGGRNKHID